jgi:hypothetical protein
MRRNTPCRRILEEALRNGAQAVCLCGRHLIPARRSRHPVVRGTPRRAIADAMSTFEDGPPISGGPFMYALRRVERRMSCIRQIPFEAGRWRQ